MEILEMQAEMLEFFAYSPNIRVRENASVEGMKL